MNKKNKFFICGLIVLVVLVIIKNFYDKDPAISFIDKKSLLDRKNDELIKNTIDKRMGTNISDNGAIREAHKVENNEDSNFAIFDKLDKAWSAKVNILIGAEKYIIYLEMRAQNDREKMQAYQEYHDYLRKKYGDKFSYNISKDQSVREKQINQRYLNSLLKLIGPEKFRQYVAAKDQFNEENLRKNKEEAIHIEF